MTLDTAFATTLRRFIYDELLTRGLPPSIADIGARFELSPDDARRSLAELRIGKTVLPHPVTGEIWMAGPFAAQPSAYRVTGTRTNWWANCAWDMLGVMQIANELVRIDTTCTDCVESLRIHATPERGVDDASRTLVVHFLLPARRWYDDIGFT